MATSNVAGPRASSGATEPGALRSFVGAVGGAAVRELARSRHVAATAATVILLAARPSTWRRTVRKALATQIVFAGVGAAGFTAGVGFLVGLIVVVQAQFWLHRVGQSEYLGPLLVAVVIREIGPLLANLIVIGRSGSGTAVELAHMRVTGEVHALDALGLDPFLYLVLPRTLGICIAIFCLSILLIVVSLLGGYTCAAVLGTGSGTLPDFLYAVARSIRGVDVLNVLLKTLLPGLLAGAICCIEGLRADSAAEIAWAGSRGVQRSVTVLFVVSAVLSLFTYL